MIRIKYDEIDIIVIIMNKVTIKVMRENLIDNQVELKIKMRNLGKGKDKDAYLKEKNKT